MPRWEKRFRCVGRSHEILGRVSAEIDRNNLRIYVPAVRIEKGITHRQFHLILTIEGPRSGAVPPQIEPILSLLSDLSQLPVKTRTTVDRTISEEVVPQRTTVALGVQGFVRRLEYSSPTSLGDPFDLDPKDEAFTTAALSSEALSNRSRAFDRLLLWLSAQQKGSWAQFQNACQALALESETDSARQIIRRLKLLGHVEASRDGKQWSISPAVIVTSSTTTDKPQYFLCGERDAQMIQALGGLAQITLEPQVGAVAPSLVRLHAHPDLDFMQSLSSLGLPVNVYMGGPVANGLAEMVPPLSEWANMLEELAHLLVQPFRVLRFDRTDFKETPFTEVSGFYQLWPLEYDNPQAIRPRYTLFYDAETSRWLRGDWYGLRFLARTIDGGRCPVSYEVTSNRLAIPGSWRWPEIYERALVLASGRLPRWKNNWLIYDGIDQSMLSFLSSKLNLQFKER